MDYIKMQQQELAARKARREQKTVQHHKFTKLPVKLQLLNGIKAGKLPKETPQEYVDRLWQERKKLNDALKHVWKCNKREDIFVRIADIETKVAEIVNTRKLKHPGV